MLQQALAKCPGCKGNPQFIFIEDFQSGDKNFSLFECPLCKLQFWSPLQNPGAEWYEANKENQARKKIIDPEWAKFLILNTWNTRKFFKAVPSLGGEKILDLACGTGAFVAEAVRQGYDAWGVDFDKEEIDLARSWGVKSAVVQDIFSFLGNNKEEFDIITGFEIVEHVENPAHLIALCFGALKKGGSLVLSTPNRNRHWGRIDESWDFPPHHLLRWDKESLRKILNAQGFEVMKIEHQILFETYVLDKVLARVGLLGKSEKENKPVSESSPRASTKRIWKYKIQKTLLFPLYMGMALLGYQGTAMLALAKKPK